MNPSSPVSDIQLVAKVWDDYYDRGLRMVSDIFLYLTRTYCADTSSPTIDKFGRQLFREVILDRQYNNSTLGQGLCQRLISFVDLLRDENHLDHTPAGKLIRMMILLPSAEDKDAEDMYTEFTQDALVKACDSYYRRKVEVLISKGIPAIEILENVKDWLSFEETVGLFLPKRTVDLMQEMFKQETLPYVLDSVLRLNSGVVTWFETENKAAFGLAARLELRARLRPSCLSPCVGLALRKKQMQLNARVKDADNTAATAIEWASATFALRKRAQDMIPILNEPGLEDASVWRAQLFSVLTAEWSAALNDVGCVSELLCGSLDEKLKKVKNEEPEADVESFFEGVLQIFDACKDKDKFIEMYRNRLARRLLNKRTRSEHLEFDFVSSLRARAGVIYTSDIKGMLEDMSISNTLSAKFSQECRDLSLISTKINVVRSKKWPAQITSERVVPLPAEINAASVEFEKFYHKMNPHRKLYWNFSFGSADVEMHLDCGTYFVNLPLISLAILQLFNEHQVCLTSQEMCRALGIGTNEVHAHLKGLYLDSRARLLLKKPETRELGENDEFRFNTKFESKHKQVHVRKVRASANAEKERDRSEAAERVKHSRAQCIDAAIVRVMKARVRLSHAQLVHEVVEQVSRRFSPSVGAIKERIGSCIVAEYLKRSEQDTTVYEYLA